MRDVKEVQQSRADKYQAGKPLLALSGPSWMPSTNWCGPMFERSWFELRDDSLDAVTRQNLSDLDFDITTIDSEIVTSNSLGSRGS